MIVPLSASHFSRSFSRISSTKIWMFLSIVRTISAGLLKSFSVLSLLSLSFPEKNPIIFLSIIREAKVIMNSYLLNNLNKIKKINFSWFINTTKSALKIDKNLLELNKKNNLKYASSASIYSIILRARGFYLMRCIEDNKKYTNKDFLNYLRLVFW